MGLVSRTSQDPKVAGRDRGGGERYEAPGVSQDRQSRYRPSCLLSRHVQRFSSTVTLKVRGQWVYLYRAVDKAGKTVDFFLSRKRDVNAAKSFLRRAMKNTHKPAKI